MATKKPGRARATERMADFVAEHVAEQVAEPLVERVTGKMAESVADKALRSRAKAQKVSDRANQHLAHMERVVERLDALEVWLRQQPGARKPRWNRDEIAAAALRLADTEGIDAVSMRRLAIELGAGTMTLYHYVKTKDELMALLLDEVLAEVVSPEPLPTFWRDAITVIARRSRDALLRHPWVFDISDDPALGPNSVRHFDQSLQALASLPVDLPAKLDIMNAVDEYVFGYCLHRRNDMNGHEGDAAVVIDYVLSLVHTGEYPALAALIEAHGAEAIWSHVQHHGADHTRFDRNLRRLLHGIALDLGL